MLYTRFTVIKPVSSELERDRPLRKIYDYFGSLTFVKIPIYGGGPKYRKFSNFKKKNKAATYTRILNENEK